VNTLDVSNWDTSSCENMQSMFIDFRGSKLDLTSFNTSKVTNMSYMFWATGYLNEIDLSSFDFSNVTNYAKMFKHASINAVIYVKDQASKDFILNMSSDDRPESWTEEDIVIKSQ
jgi:surface protein